MEAPHQAKRPLNPEVQGQGQGAVDVVARARRARRARHVEPRDSGLDELLPHRSSQTSLWRARPVDVRPHPPLPASQTSEEELGLAQEALPGPAASEPQRQVGLWSSEDRPLSAQAGLDADSPSCSGSGHILAGRPEPAMVLGSEAYGATRHAIVLSAQAGAAAAGLVSGLWRRTAQR